MKYGLQALFLIRQPPRQLYGNGKWLFPLPSHGLKWSCRCLSSYMPVRGRSNLVTGGVAQLLTQSPQVPSPSSEVLSPIIFDLSKIKVWTYFDVSFKFWRATELGATAQRGDVTHILYPNLSSPSLPTSRRKKLLCSRWPNHVNKCCMLRDTTCVFEQDGHQGVRQFLKHQILK